MIFSDNIIEKKGFFLRNLITTNLASNTWTSGSSSYGFYSCPYEYTLGANQLYYGRYTYKFTTTNQSPTWVRFYIQGGSSTLSGAGIDNPVANTEYTASGVGSINASYGSISLSSGTLYNGNSNAISGVTAYVKNVFLYDVTELYDILKQAGTVSTTTELKTWCDDNLQHSPRYTNYDITNLISAEIEKIAITKGTVLADDFVETDGLDFYATTAAIRANKYFDTGSALSIYNNSGGGTVTHTRVDAKAQNSPFWVEHPYVLQITTNGTASPGAGGFVCSHTAAANRIVIERFVAKIPVGYTITSAYNAQGTGAVVSYLSSQAGTGDWAEYAILYKCGSSGTFSSGGHVYISGSNNTSVTWYVAYCMSAIITDAEYLKNYTVLGNVERIKGGTFFSRQFDNLNLFPAGNGAKQITLPSGWSYDTDDVAGSAKASIVQAVNTGATFYSDFIPIVPAQRYKVSFWVKCKGDMTSFLTAIVPYLSNKTTELNHSNVSYVTGTMTKLSAALNSGDTTITLTSASNWVVKNNSFLGFRSSTTSKSYNDLGNSNGNGSPGMIDSVSGNVVTLKTAYTGTARAANTIIVEAFAGSTYPYPISKSQLPTNNEWKYVEGYFGANTIWDGRGGAWAGMPFDAAYIKLRLNIYANTGTVPIKYSDIRIEPVIPGGKDRYEQKIDIIGGN